MNKKIKALIAIGGTGGHVFPGYNLAKHLKNKNFDVQLVTDKRGLKYLKGYKNLKIQTLSSSPLIKKNIFMLFTSLFLIFFSIINSIFFLIFNRPHIIFGMGGYASLPICIAASILKIKFVIYENNLIIGKANKFLLKSTYKVLVSNKELEGIPEKYVNKIFEIGNIINQEIINFSNKESKNISNKKINILILGGSQAAQIFAEVLPNIFKKCVDQGISIKIFQHCLSNQNEKLQSFYKSHNIDYEIFNFSYNLIEYFSKVDLAITRSGSSMLAELINANIPFISVPLPTSAENHQLKNAIYYQKKNFSLLIEEKDLKEKLLFNIKEIYNNSSILSNIKDNQRQHSDKNVYNNVDRVLKEITDEKN